MATTFDRFEFIRDMREKPGLSPETLEALADAMYHQAKTADLATRGDLGRAVERLTLWVAGMAAAQVIALASFVSSIKFFT